jgi:hypothetical protein
LFSPAVFAEDQIEDLTPPILSIISPESDFENKARIIISGTVSDDVTKPELIKVEFFKIDGTPIRTITPTPTGDWTLTLENQLEGKSSYNIIATDESGNEYKKELSITVDLTRPKVLPSVLPGEDKTRIPIDTIINLVIFDTNFSKLSIPDPIIVRDKNFRTIEGETTFDANSKSIVFKPIPNLTNSTKYFVSVNPLLKDDAKNPIYPFSWSFTTVSNNDITQNPMLQDPHGQYSTNVNTCINCHSTHVSKGSKLNGQKYNDSLENYCMACHDGTSAPMADNSNQSHVHNYPTAPDPLEKNVSCGSCHNPHLNWSNENPNLLKDHYTYEHPNNPVEDSQIYDSDNYLCEKCHGMDTKYLKDLSDSPSSGVQYSTYHYRKSTTSTGLKSDFDLCLRCHNGKRATDIAKYYEDTSSSNHKITALDGKNLNGHIPCAECHETHGSTNIKQLKRKLGHDQPQVFDVPTGDWLADSQLERTFCIKCHNGNTAIYGVVGKILDPVKSEGHLIDTSKACSTCHGDGSTPADKARSAAHGPILP